MKNSTKQTLKAAAIAVVGAGFLVMGAIFFSKGVAAYSCAEAVKAVQTMNASKTNLGIQELGYKFPSKADYIAYDGEDNLVLEGSCEYTDNNTLLFMSELDNQILFHSGPEDGMIYTTGKGKTADGQIVDLLYIGDPVTNDLIAASITWEDGTDILYTFYDSNGTTIYDRQK